MSGIQYKFYRTGTVRFPKLYVQNVQNSKWERPRYLQEIFTLRVSSYELRDFENKLFVLKPRTDYLKRSFGYSGAVL